MRISARVDHAQIRRSLDGHYEVLLTVVTDHEGEGGLWGVAGAVSEASQEWVVGTPVLLYKQGGQSGYVRCVVDREGDPSPFQKLEGASLQVVLA